MTINPSTKLTYEDYVALPDDGQRHEIVDGEHYVVPAPFIKHQAISGRFFAALWNHLAKYPVGRVLAAPCDVVLSELDVVQPDIIYISRERESIITEKNIQGSPDLLVEILSESTRRTDEITKRRLYERFGIPEYWIVDPVVETAKIYRLVNGRYERLAEISNETAGRLETPLLPGFAMDIADLFRD